MKQTYTYGKNSFSLDLTSAGKVHQITIGEKTFKVELVRAEDHRLDLLIDGVPTNAHVSIDGTKLWVTTNGQTLVLTNSVEARRIKTHSGQHENQMTARMPGLVRAVLVSEGERVIKGQTLAVIEAMKMENKLTAPFDGWVRAVMIKTGQTVEREQVLLELSQIDEKETGKDPNPG